MFLHSWLNWVEENRRHESKSLQTVLSKYCGLQFYNATPTLVLSWVGICYQHQYMPGGWGTGTGAPRDSLSPLPAPASNSAALWTMYRLSIGRSFPFLFPGAGQINTMTAVTFPGMISGAAHCVSSQGKCVPQKQELRQPFAEYHIWVWIQIPTPSPIMNSSSIDDIFCH